MRNLRNPMPVQFQRPLGRFRTMSGFLATFTLLASGCGGGGGDEATSSTATNVRYEVTFQDPVRAAGRGGTLFTLVSADGRVRVSAGMPSTWNTYCASPSGEVHFFVASANSTMTWTALAKPNSSLHTSYVFARDGELRLSDLGNERQYHVGPRGSEVGAESRWKAMPPTPFICAPYTVGSWQYRYGDGELLACSDPKSAQCDRVAIHGGTFPYAFAEARGKVLVATNWGDLLIHRPGRGWCRAVPKGNEFACTDAAEAPIPEAPRGFQFYSSVRYGEHTLLGRWPGGQVYRFDGALIQPDEDTPPLPDDAVKAQAEAQSMAVYCGNLFVGYWPRGDLWMREAATSAWRHAGRAFSHPKSTNVAIPYSDQAIPGVDSSFLGQRISSLVPYGDSLYLSTSNLRGWYQGIESPSFLTANQIDEYGRVWRLRQPGCATAHVRPAPVVKLQFEISEREIRIRQDQSVLAQAANPGIMPVEGDELRIGEGVFGKFDGELTVRRLP